MKPWQYVTTLMLALTCLVLSVSVILVSSARQRMQEEANLRQMQLNAGVLGSQGQQIRMSILQDMANSAVNNPKMRRLLTRHGYSLQSMATNAPAGAREELP